VGLPYQLGRIGRGNGLAVLLENPEGTHIQALIEVKACLRKGDVEH